MPQFSKMGSIVNMNPKVILGVALLAAKIALPHPELTIIPSYSQFTAVPTSNYT